MMRKYILTILLMASTQLYSANYEGIYIGGFNGPTDDGAFAVLVKSNNYAIVMGYDSVDNFGFINESIYANSNGSFSNSNVDGYGSSIQGTATFTSISGTFNSSSGGSGTFSGAKQSYNGFAKDHDGYYKGTFSASCPSANVTGSGYFRAITSSDGNIYVYTQYTSSNISGVVGSKDGGILTASSDYSFSGYTVNGAYISGSIGGTNVSGTSSFKVYDGYGHSYNCSATFSGSLNYPLNATDSDSDKVTNSNDNCPSTYNPSQADNDNDSLGDACDTDDDNDGYTDQEELDAGSNPLDVNDVPSRGGTWRALLPYILNQE